MRFSSSQPALCWLWIWTWIWIYPLAQAERHNGTATATTTTHTKTSHTTAVSTETPGSPQPPSYTSLPDFQRTVLDSSNQYRTEHNAIHLEWNDTLTEYALDWAKTCIWKHSKGPYGENLAFGYPNASASVIAWGEERTMYDFDLPTGYTEETGHFTQLVWRETTQVGCAAFDCGYNADTDTDGEGGRPRRAKGWYVVCEYSPGGNVIANDDLPPAKGAKWRYFDEDAEDPKKKWFKLNVLPYDKRVYPSDSDSKSSSSSPSLSPPALLLGERGVYRTVGWCMILVHGFFLLL